MKGCPPELILVGAIMNVVINIVDGVRLIISTMVGSGLVVVLH